MILQAKDLFEETGCVNAIYASYLAGQQKLLKPLQDLHFIQQQLHDLQPVVIQEQVKAGVYITFDTATIHHKLQEASPVQVLPVYEDALVDWEVTRKTCFSWTQIYIGWDQLAAITGEKVEHVQNFFQRHVSNKTGAPLNLTLTQALANDFNQLIHRQGKQLVLVGKLYDVVLQTVEHIQIQHHISQCDDCQKKLFTAQNQIEANHYLSSEEMAKSIGLTQTALEIGFTAITGMTVGEYQIEVAFRKAMAQPHSGLSLANRLTADTGWTKQDIEKACLKRFGVMSHQLGSMQ